MALSIFKNCFNTIIDEIKDDLKMLSEIVIFHIEEIKEEKDLKK